MAGNFGFDKKKKALSSFSFFTFTIGIQLIVGWHVRMSRKKKVKDSIVKRAKKASDKQKPTNKPRYISKADRAKLEEDDRPLED